MVRSTLFLSIWNLEDGLIRLPQTLCPLSVPVRLHSTNSGLSLSFESIIMSRLSTLCRTEVISFISYFCVIVPKFNDVAWKVKTLWSLPCGKWRKSEGFNSVLTAFYRNSCASGRCCLRRSLCEPAVQYQRDSAKFTPQKVLHCHICVERFGAKFYGPNKVPAG